MRSKRAPGSISAKISTKNWPSNFKPDLLQVLRHIVGASSSADKDAIEKTSLPAGSAGGCGPPSTGESEKDHAGGSKTTSRPGENDHDHVDRNKKRDREGTSKKESKKEHKGKSKKGHKSESQKDKKDRRRKDHKDTSNMECRDRSEKENKHRSKKEHKDRSKKEHKDESKKSKKEHKGESKKEHKDESSKSKKEHKCESKKDHKGGAQHMDENLQAAMDAEGAATDANMAAKRSRLQESLVSHRTRSPPHTAKRNSHADI